MSQELYPTSRLQHFFRNVFFLILCYEQLVVNININGVLMPLSFQTKALLGMLCRQTTFLCKHSIIVHITLYDLVEKLLKLLFLYIPHKPGRVIPIQLHSIAYLSITSLSKLHAPFQWCWSLSIISGLLTFNKVPLYELNVLSSVSSVQH